MALLKLRSQISPTNRAWNDAQTLTCILQAPYSLRESDYSPACRSLRKERESEGGESVLFVCVALQVRQDKFIMLAVTEDNFMAWTHIRLSLSTPVTATYSYPCSLGRWLVIHCLSLVHYIHAHTDTQLQEQKCLGCLQRWVKDIKKPSITQINWANGKCDSRAAEVLFTTQSHLQAEEQRSQGCENTDSSRSLYRVVKGKI